MYVDAPNQVIEAAGGVQYAYRRCGPPGAYPLVLLQHFRGTLDSWDSGLIDALAAERDVIVFDHAGVGLSTGTICRTVRELTADTFAFLDALGVRQPDVLGYSMGGFTTQEMALLRLGAVRRLVLAATAPRGATGIHGYPDDVLAHADFDQLGIQDYLYTFFNHTETSQRSGLEFVGRYIERERDRDLPVTTADRAAQYEAVVEWGIPDHRALQRLAAIDHPVFVAGGDSDLVVPRRLLHLLAGLLPNAQVKIYPDSGHGFLFQHHRQFAQDVLRFLR
ncbi:alpha/beta fold hydrolase [Streptomyces mirabilis]|uniref:Alpha/beta hydrolase n=1 Tax=Streptomyces mirabilis TaxID=68239 RepID=A0ABU3V5I7_9ACTN|nr:alpha/beta hydrolase [Streptomyces mirabilis]MCX5355794.1 alpha/beta hydrolase [Streptomyces mirabilis]MDU9001436.1 alpha/beta hydrolase [Streptomyces mirabilis]